MADAEAKAKAEKLALAKKRVCTPNQSSKLKLTACVGGSNEEKESEGYRRKEGGEG